ncbi:MAG: hypothetical protein AB7O39_01075 [Flavobacteriaceae bacterium]
MDWLAVILLLLKLLDAASRALSQRRLIGEGQAAAAMRATGKARDVIENAREAARTALDAPLDADGDGVPDDDGYRRD